MRCLVTGASGHLGSYLTAMLVARGHKVTILVRPQSDLWRLSATLSQVDIIRGDLSDIHSSASDIRGAAPEAVFHLGWHGVTSQHRNDPLQIKTNLIGSIGLLEIALQAGCACFAGLGSQAEYGPYDQVLREDLTERPATLYGATKLCAGILTRRLCEGRGVRHLWLRLLATYGPKDDASHLIPSVILKLLAGEKPALTPGEQQWDYLYVEDAAEAIYRLAIATEAGGTFILSSGETRNVRSIIERIRDLIDPRLPLGFGELPYSPDQVHRLEGDISRLRQAAGWRPQVPLDEGLRKTVDWYRSQSEFGSGLPSGC